jgi:hypothetical protein
MKQPVRFVLTPCNYPECTRHAGTSWALVDVCFHHRDLIEAETMAFYLNKHHEGAPIKTQNDRKHYNKIRHLTPWERRA